MWGNSVLPLAGDWASQLHGILLVLFPVEGKSDQMVMDF